MARGMVRQAAQVENPGQESGHESCEGSRCPGHAQQLGTGPRPATPAQPLQGGHLAYDDLRKPSMVERVEKPGESTHGCAKQSRSSHFRGLSYNPNICHGDRSIYASDPTAP